MFVKSKGEGNLNHITAGKVYAADSIDAENPIYEDATDLCTIFDDKGDKLLIRISGCAHLGFMPWTVCDSEGNQL